MSDFKKTVLITGANTGIGEATARELARRGARVFFACRSEEKTRPVMAAVAKATGNTDLHFLELKLDDLESVARATQAFLARHEPLHVLVLNAGLARVKGLTKQGFELTFGVNHLGHFLLTLGLEPALRAGVPSRVVTVASRAHERTSQPIDFDQLREPHRSATGWREYQVSKLANMLFTKELARRWAGTGITTAAVHPGVIASDIWRTTAWPLRKVAMLFMRTPEQGATASLRCATAPELEGVTGGYFGEDGLPRACSPLAEDLAAATRLWDLSVGWTAPFRAL